MAARPSAWSRRLVRLALRAFPKSFRNRYGAEILAAWEDQALEGRGSPRRLLRLLHDLITSGLAERVTTARARQTAAGSGRKGGAVVRGFSRDLVYAARALARHPRFTLVALATLGLGLGGVTVMFSLVSGVLLDPLPFPESNRLVRVFDTQVERGSLSSTSSPANFLDWRDRTRGVELAAFNTGTMTYNGIEPAEAVVGAYVSAGFFPVLGVAPLLGRGFTREEEAWGNHRVVILGHGFWQRHSGGDRGILGRTILIEGEPHVVVGVMPPGFAFPTETTELWRPLAFDFDVSTSRGVHYLTVLGRLEPDESVAGAESALRMVMGQLAAAYPERLEGWGVRLTSLEDALIGGSRSRLYLMFGAVGLVLLIAVVNVANLSLARAVDRSRELALRLAIGARRWQLSRQLIAEGLLLATGSAIAGLLLSWALLRFILPAAAGTLPRLENVALDGTVFGFAFLLLLAVGLVLGLAPSLAWASPQLQESLKEGGPRGSQGRGHGRLRGAFVIAQVSLAIMLAVGAGLLIRSYGALTAVDPGYGTERALVATVGVPGSRYPEPSDRSGFFLELQDRLEALPGVTAAAISTQLPLEGYSINFSYYLEGEEDLPTSERHSGDFRVVSPGYFRTMGIPLRQGRDFTRQDSREHPLVIIIDEALARRHFGNESPVGRRIYPSYGNEAPREIIGVVGEVRQRGLAAPVEPGYYLPVTQESWSSMRVILTTNGDPSGYGELLRREVAGMDPLLAVRDVRTLQERFDSSIRSPRLNTLLLGLFAALAVLLSAAGIYSVVSYVVTRRTHEIGVRMALGAPRAEVRRGVVLGAMRLAGAGVALGLVGAVLLTGLLKALLFEVSPTDPWSFGAAGLLFAGVALVGSYLPARRASSVDPLIALRSD